MQLLDIDYIEIRSDADETGIEGDKARRTYNYRVSMLVNEFVFYLYESAVHILLSSLQL